MSKPTIDSIKSEKADQDGITFRVAGKNEDGDEYECTVWAEFNGRDCDVDEVFKGDPPDDITMMAIEHPDGARLWQEEYKKHG